MNIKKSKAIFLDRDGTINLDKDYLYKIEEFKFLPGVIEGLYNLQLNGYKLIIITNQSGIARGYYSENEYFILTKWMIKALSKKGIDISAVYYCPHHPNAKIEKYRTNCKCRKPNLGLFEQAMNDFNIDLSQSYAIGDKIRDCAICNTTECKGFLISHNEKKEIIEDVKNGKFDRISYAENLKSAVDIICSSKSN